VIALGWYMGGEVYGKQQKASLISLADTSTQKQDPATPELSKERIELLRKIAAIANEDELSAMHTSTDDTHTFNSLSSVATKSDEPELVNGFKAVNSKWESSQNIDKYTGVKEGLAFSNWTALSTSADRFSEKIQASLVASCNDKGERSLYIRMLSAYPGFETAQRANIVTGQVGWDSSSSYSAPFTYDVRLNALRLRAGIEDSLSMIKDGKKVTIQLPWYNGHQAAFEFSLKGSSQAIDKVFDYCLS